MPNKNERRLDSLARLLEGNHICAAVCAVGDKVYIATNQLTKGSRQETRNRLQDLLKVLSVKVFGEEDLKIFKKVVLESVKSSAQGKMTLNDGEILVIAEKFARQGFEEWNKTTIVQLKQQYKTYSRLSDAVMVHSLAERLATDFLKVRKEIRDNKVSNLLHRKSTFEILEAEKSGVHAEMTILDKLLQEGNAAPVYIGISKKCCDKCTDVIKAVNVALGAKIEIDDSEEEIPDTIQVSGVHPQQPANWVKPSFLSRDDETCKAINKAYMKILKDKEPAEKLERSEHDMIPDRSDSPPPSPSGLGFKKLVIESNKKGKLSK